MLTNGDIMTELDLKRQYAEKLLKYPNDPFKGALELFPEDTNMAMRVATEWPLDEDVVLFKKDMFDNSPDKMEFVPKKYEIATKLWERAHRPGVSDADYVKMMDLYNKVIEVKEEKSGNELSEIFSEIIKKLPV